MTAPRPPLGPVRQPAWEVEPAKPARGLPATVIARGADTDSAHGAAVTPQPVIPSVTTRLEVER
jgi:hypothetical protein